jgi:hypothetical protein
MGERNAGRAAGLAIVVGTAVLPLLGALIGHCAIADVFRFPPPLRIPTDYPRWSWVACALVVGLLASIMGSWLLSRRATGEKMSAEGVRPRASSALSWWGWVALVWVALWWMLAWTRFAWFASAQRFTFLPLWLGFIVGVNALTQWRAGTCLMRRAPGQWFGLFAASAAFWWVFEWLNRFAHNWHYLGVEDFGPVAYAGHATLCFSTVLPAVAAVRECLRTFPRWEARCAKGPAWPWFARRTTGAMLVAGGIVALALTGANPQMFYAALWVAPLALVLGEGVLARRSGVSCEIAVGDWRRAASWMIAALVCGFFWELWNLHSAARWIYTVPYVDRWHLFEMPLLGYAGYFAFGLECLAVVESLLGAKET